MMVTVTLPIVSSRNKSASGYDYLTDSVKYDGHSDSVYCTIYKLLYVKVWWSQLPCLLYRLQRTLYDDLSDSVKVWWAQWPCLLHWVQTTLRQGMMASVTLSTVRSTKNSMSRYDHLVALPTVVRTNCSVSRYDDLSDSVKIWWG